jgi:hypothetical protein
MRLGRKGRVGNSFVYEAAGWRWGGGREEERMAERKKERRLAGYRKKSLTASSLKAVGVKARLARGNVPAPADENRKRSKR